MKGLAQTVLTWEGKVFAAADAAETDWKHKVTPERGDLINYNHCKVCGMKFCTHSQTSMVQPLKILNGSIISSHTLQDM